MARKLTTKAVENLKPGPKRRELSDGGSGLFLVLQPSGHRSWALRYRAEGRPTKLTLGGWPEVSLALARKLAADALHDLSNGTDPAATKKSVKIEGDTVQAICEQFLRRESAKLRTAERRERLLRRHVYPSLGDRQVDAIRRSEIVHMLDKVEDGSGTRTADLVLAFLRRCLNWHATRSDTFRSPIIAGMSRQNIAAARRSRILEDEELRQLWAATADGRPFSGLIRFLLLTGARRTEAASLRWSEISDCGVWTLPASRSKTKVEVVRPLSRAAQAVLAGQPRSDLPWVFTTTGIGPLQSFSKPKADLDAASGVSGYRLHDLRRTSRSLLSRAGINTDLAERCLGHAPPAIIQTYDRHRYVNEMTHAFEVLAALIERIVDPAGAAVVPFRR